MDASSRVSPFRQRMIDDMRMRTMAEKPQTHYLCWVQRFSAFLGRSPSTATVEDLRRYQLHLVDSGTSPVSLNAATSSMEWKDTTPSCFLLPPQLSFCACFSVQAESSQTRTKTG
jgi:hypothetical protein